MTRTHTGWTCILEGVWFKELAGHSWSCTKTGRDWMIRRDGEPVTTAGSFQQATEIATLLASEEAS